MCHVAQDGEDDGGGKEACEGVDGADDQGVPVAVVVELVVASQGEKSSNADSIRVEDLSASVWGVGIILVKGFLCNCLSRWGNGSRQPGSNCFQEEGRKSGKEGELTDPNLRLPESLPLRSEQELQSVARTLQERVNVNKMTPEKKNLPQV